MPENPLILTISGIATDNKSLTLKWHSNILHSTWGENCPKKMGRKTGLQLSVLAYPPTEVGDA